MSRIDEMIKAHGPFAEGTDLSEMMGVYDARQSGVFPDDATNEEITALFNIWRSGYRGMTLEDLRDNRNIALSTLDAAEARATANNAKATKRDSA